MKKYTEEEVSNILELYNKETHNWYVIQKVILI
jgi:hypothetical protein